MKKIIIFIVASSVGVLSSYADIVTATWEVYCSRNPSASECRSGYAVQNPAGLICTQAAQDAYNAIEASDAAENT